jgi:hypothetical protein
MTPRRSRAPVQTFLVEQYFPQVSGPRVVELARELLRERSDGADLLGLVGVPGDETLLGLFAATSPEAVAGAVAPVEMTAERIVPAFWLPMR